MLLMKIGILLNGIVAVILAVPIVRYLLSPVARGHKGGYESWVSLGNLEQFPSGQTRLATYRNPVVNPRTAIPQISPAGFAMWTGKISRSSPSTARTSDARFAGFRNPSLFMCPCHGGAYYQDGSRASGPPERGLFQYHYKIENGKLFIKAGEMPTPGQPGSNIVTGDTTMRLIDIHRRMVRCAPAAWLRPSAKPWSIRIPRETCQLVLCFRQRCLRRVHLQIVTGIMLALIYVPSAGEAWNSLQTLNHNVALGMVHSSSSRLGLEFHGRDRSDPHGPGLSICKRQRERPEPCGSGRWRP